MDEVAHTASAPKKRELFASGSLQVALVALLAAFANSYGTLVLENIPFEGHPPYIGPDFSVWEVDGPAAIYLIVGVLAFAPLCGVMDKTKLERNVQYLALVMACFYGYGSYELWCSLPYKGSNVIGYLGFQSIISVGTAIHPYSVTVYYLLLLTLAVAICRQRKIQPFPTNSVLLIANHAFWLFVGTFVMWLAMFGTFWILPH
jgi:hypothetical protein